MNHTDIKSPFLSKPLTRFSIALFSGLIGALSFSPFSIWPALFITMSTAIWLLSKAISAKQAFQYGFILGLGFFGAGVSWVYVSIVQYGQVGVILSILATLLFVSVLALFYGFAFLLSWKIKYKLPNWPTVLIWAVSLLFAEYLRSTLFTGFPWLLIGYSLHHTWLFELSPVGGIWLLSFLAILTFSLPFSLVMYFRSTNAQLNEISTLFQRIFQQHTFQQHVVPLSILLSAWGGGLYLATSNTSWVESTGSIQTTLVQGNVRQDQKWLPSNAKPILDHYIETSFQNLDSDLIVWPETAITYLYNDIEPYLSGFDDIFIETQTTLVTGVPLIKGDSNGNNNAFYNAVWATGNGSGLYLKQRLVPFGEYIPFQEQIGKVLDIFGIPLESFKSGTSDQAPLSVGKHLLSTFICYEVAYPETVRNMVKNSDLLLTVSNDGWFGDSIGPWQHLEIAQFRAKESGRYLLRATNTGITAIMNAQGEIVEQLPQFTRDTLTADIQLMQGITPYIQYGNLLVLSLLLLSLALQLLTLSITSPTLKNE